MLIHGPAVEEHGPLRAVLVGMLREGDEKREF
jgi:hypothetical protein